MPRKGVKLNVGDIRSHRGIQNKRLIKVFHPNTFRVKNLLPARQKVDTRIRSVASGDREILYPNQKLEIKKVLINFPLDLFSFNC